MNWEFFATNILFHEILHFLAAAVISIFIFKKFKSRKLVLVVFLVSFLMDTDHLTEGVMIYGLNFRKMLFPFRGGFFREAGYMTIFFHSWEFLPIIIYVSKKINRFSYGIAISLAIVGHLLIDQLVYTSLYGMSLLQYSLIYRVANRFDFWKLCGGCQ